MSDTYQFLLVRSERKTLVMEIKEDGSLVVRSPQHMGIERIRQFVTSNTAWIERRRASILARPLPKPKSFVESEEILFLGRSYPLRLGSQSDRIGIVDEEFLFPRQCLDQASANLIAWYKW